MYGGLAGSNSSAKFREYREYQQKERDAKKAKAEEEREAKKAARKAREAETGASPSRSWISSLFRGGGGDTEKHELDTVEDTQMEDEKMRKGSTGVMEVVKEGSK